MSHPPEVLPTTDASYGKVFSRSQKMQARIASQRGFDQPPPPLPHQQLQHPHHHDNDNYQPEKEIFGGSMVPQRSARMLTKARSIKNFNQNLANINKNKHHDQPSQPPPPPRIAEEQQPQQPTHPSHHHHHAVSPPQFSNPTQAAMFEEFQERELNKLREINALQKQREEEERLLREEEASARLRELRLVRDNRLAVEREEEKIREAKRKEEEARIRAEQEQQQMEASRREAERKAREEEARIHELMLKQKKAAKKKKLQDEIDTLLDEEDLLEALNDQKQLILSGGLSDGDMAAAIERLQNLERYLQQRQQGVAPSPIRRSSQGSYSQPPPPPARVLVKKNPTAKEIAAMSDAQLEQAVEDTRNSLLDFDTKSEAELLDLYQVLTNLETETTRRQNGDGGTMKQDLESQRRELQYKMQEERNGADVQRQIMEQRARLEKDQLQAQSRAQQEQEQSDWAKANQLKLEKMKQMRFKEAQLKEAEAQRAKEKEVQLHRAQEMRQRLIDEERRVDQEDRLAKDRLDKQLMHEKEEMVEKLQQKLDAEEKLRAKKDEYQRAKELQLQQERDLAERQRLLEKKQRLLEEKRRAQEERTGSERQQHEMLEQKKGAALLLQEKENLIAQLQRKIEEEEKLRAKKESLKRQNSLKRQESLKKQESVKTLKKQVSFNSSVEVGVFQQEQAESPRQQQQRHQSSSFLSDSDSDSDEGAEGVASHAKSVGQGGASHFSFRDGREVNGNENQTADLYLQKRNGLRPVNPDSYQTQRRKSRNGFDEDQNASDRDSEELRSAKFNYSNLGDDAKGLKKKHSFNASFDNPMADRGKPPPPPAAKKKEAAPEGKGGWQETLINKKKQQQIAASQPSVLARWPPAQNCK